MTIQKAGSRLSTRSFFSLVFISFPVNQKLFQKLFFVYLFKLMVFTSNEISKKLIYGIETWDDRAQCFWVVERKNV